MHVDGTAIQEKKGGFVFYNFPLENKHIILDWSEHITVTKSHLICDIYSWYDMTASTSTFQRFALLR